MFCTHCGTKNNDNAVYCVGCGAYLANDAQLGQSQPPRQPQSPQSQYNQQQQQQQPWGYQTQNQYQYPPQQPVYPPYQGHPNQFQYNNPSKGKIPALGAGITSMIFGILAILFVFTIETPSGWYYSDADFWVPFLMFVVPFGVLGLVLGGVASGQAKQVGRKNGFAVAGIICAAIALGLSMIPFMIYLSWAL